MTYFLILFFLIFLFDSTYYPNFQDDHISIKKSNAIKGIFVALIFLSHCASYLELKVPSEVVYTKFKSYMGQMVVTPFLFFSGYGIMESIKIKGISYIKKIPKNRIFKVWIHFVFALLLFVFLRFLQSENIPIKQFILSMISWESIGNSNWYILAILLSYSFTYIAFMWFSNSNNKAAVLIGILTCITIFILKKYRPHYYYDTLLCFPTGIWYSLYGSKLERWIKNGKKIRYYLTTAGCLCLFMALNHYRNKSIIIYEAAAVTFILSIILISLTICLNNNIIQYFGNHIFSIYILQRLPMIFFKNFIDLTQNTYLYVILCFSFTIIIAMTFDFAMKKLDSLLKLGE